MSGCGGGGDDSSGAEVRLVNASTGYSSLDLTVDSKSINSNVAYGTAGSFGGISTGATSSQVLAGGTTVAALTPTLQGGNKYSLIAYGWSGAARTTLLQESQAAPESGKTTLLVFNLAPDAGALSVYLSADCNSAIENATVIASSVAGGAGSGYNTTTAGTYCVRVTGSGTSDLRLTVPSINLASAQVATLILTPTTGGVLVNGMLLVQGGSVTNYPGSNARARVIGAVSGGARVAAVRGTSTLLVSSVAPVAGEYTTIAPGNTSIDVTVGAATTPISVTPTLANGGDYTVLVWGTPAAPQVTVITDDNRLPTVAGQAKMRLINGSANLPGGLTMTVDFGVVANNVQPGTASTYGVLNSSTAASLSVTSPAYADPIYPTTANTTVPIVAGGVYDMIVMGDGASLTTLRSALRKVR